MLNGFQTRLLLLHICDTSGCLLLEINNKQNSVNKIDGWSRDGSTTKYAYKGS